MEEGKCVQEEGRWRKWSVIIAKIIIRRRITQQLSLSLSRFEIKCSRFSTVARCLGDCPFCDTSPTKCHYMVCRLQSSCRCGHQYRTGIERGAAHRFLCPPGCRFGLGRILNSWILNNLETPAARNSWPDNGLKRRMTRRRRRRKRRRRRRKRNCCGVELWNCFTCAWLIILFRPK